MSQGKDGMLDIYFAVAKLLGTNFGDEGPKPVDPLRCDLRVFEIRGRWFASWIDPEADPEAPGGEGEDSGGWLGGAVYGLRGAGV